MQASSTLPRTREQAQSHYRGRSLISPPERRRWAEIAPWGEIRGLRWDDDRKEVLTICRSVWKRHRRARKQKRTIDGPGFGSVDSLTSFTARCGQARECCWFRLRQSRWRIDLDNLANRAIKPIFEANGMEWKGLHAYRRGLATNLKELAWKTPPSKHLEG